MRTKANALKENSLKKMFDVIVNVPVTGTIYSANGKRVYVKIHGESYYNRRRIQFWMEHDLLVEVPKLPGKNYQIGDNLTVIPTLITWQGLIFGKEAQKV